MNDRSKNCWTCGRPRGLEQKRDSWGINSLLDIPRAPDGKPAQIANDLIVSAGAYRNGGTNNETHLCNECVRDALRWLKGQISEQLAELDSGHDKDAELTEARVRLARLQHYHHNAVFEHNRMQERLAHVLSRLEVAGMKDDETTASAKWEVRRGPIKEKE